MTLTIWTKDRPLLEIRKSFRASFRWINESVTNMPLNYILTVKYEKGQLKHHFKTFHDAVRKTPGKLLLRRRTDCSAVEPQRHLIGWKPVTKLHPRQWKRSALPFKFSLLSSLEVSFWFPFSFLFEFLVFVHLILFVSVRVSFTLSDSRLLLLP